MLDGDGQTFKRMALDTCVSLNEKKYHSRLNRLNKYGLHVFNESIYTAIRYHSIVCTKRNEQKDGGKSRNELSNSEQFNKPMDKVIGFFSHSQ